MDFTFDGLEIGGYRFGVGGTYWLADDLGLNSSLSIANSASDNSGVGGSSSLESTGYGLSLGLRKPFKKTDSLAIVYGSNIGYRYSKSESQSVVSSTSRSKFYFVDVLLGVEYFFNRQVSVSADYAVIYSKSKSKNEISTVSSRGISDNVSGLNLHVYF